MREQANTSPQTTVSASRCGVLAAPSSAGTYHFVRRQRRCTACPTQESAPACELECTERGGRSDPPDA